MINHSTWPTSRAWSLNVTVTVPGTKHLLSERVWLSLIFYTYLSTWLCSIHFASYKLAMPVPDNDIALKSDMTEAPEGVEGLEVELGDTKASTASRPLAEPTPCEGQGYSAQYAVAAAIERPSDSSLPSSSAEDVAPPKKRHRADEDEAGAQMPEPESTGEVSLLGAAQPVTEPIPTAASTNDTGVDLITADLITMAFDVWIGATSDLVISTAAAPNVVHPHWDLPKPSKYTGYQIDLSMRSDVEGRQYLWPCEPYYFIVGHLYNADGSSYRCTHDIERS